jgi:hypothetical protein
MNKRFPIILIGLLALAIILTAGCSQSSSGAQQTLQNYNLVNGVITVSAGSYYNISFTVTSAMTNPSLTGSFTASGGSGNDIIALMLDDTSLTNWVNGHQVNTFYNSGQLTTSNINVSITTPGTYHLIFSNKLPTTLRSGY